MAPMPDVLPAAPVGWRGSSRYSTNQTAILTPLTRVSRPHHQDTGFDQAREPDRACHSKLIRRSTVIELTSDCNNTVMRRGQSRREYCARVGDGAPVVRRGHDCNSRARILRDAAKMPLLRMRF